MWIIVRVIKTNLWESKGRNGRSERGCYILSETHFGLTEYGAGNRHAEKELLKDLWVKYSRCSTSIHLRWEQNHSPSYSFLREEKNCSGYVVTMQFFLLDGIHSFIKVKSLVKSFKFTWAHKLWVLMIIVITYFYKLFLHSIKNWLE